MGQSINRVWTRQSPCVIFFITQCLFGSSVETNFWKSRHRSAQQKSPHIDLAHKLTTQFPSSGVRSVSMASAVRCPVPASFIKENGKVFSALSPARGTVRKVSFPRNPSKNGPVVVHIQDVHNNSQAQKNIRDTVYSLGRSGVVSQVALEGAHGPIRLQPYWNYTNQNAVAKAADSLLKKNRISGPIRAALSLRGGLVEFVGVDDLNGYKANVRAYRASAPLQDQRRIQVNRLRQKLAEEKKSVYSPTLLDLDNAVEAYRAGKISLGAYVEGIAKVQSPPEQVRAFLKAVRTEREMDLNKVETERQELIGNLSGRLNERDVNELLAHSLAVRAGEIRSTDFYSFFDRLCRKNGLSLKAYLAFDEYVQYVLETDEIDAEKLMVQLTRSERDAYYRLAVTPAQRRLVKESHRAWLTKKLVNFDLTRAEWEEYVNTEEKSFTEDVGHFESFYREAEARDRSIASNVLKSLGSSPTQVSVLVTGGYHAQGIVDELTQHGVTVLSFVPKIDHVDSAEGSVYLSVFSQEKTPLEKMFVGDRLFLAPVPDAGLTYEGTLVVPGLDVLDRKIGPRDVAEFIKFTTGVDANVKVERKSDGSRVTLTVVTDGQTYMVHVTPNAELEVGPAEEIHPTTRFIIDTIQEFYIRTFKRGQWVYPTVVVLPVGASMGITVPPRTFKSDGSGKLDYVRVPNYFALNGTPVPWRDRPRVWAENSGNLETMISEAGLLTTPQSVGIPTNNVGLNFGYMVYHANGTIYHKTGEADQASPHLWVVISQGGEAWLQTIQFRPQGDKWVPQTADKRDFPAVKAAFRGPTLIQNGVVRIDPDEWEDLRHLFRLPMFDIPEFSGITLAWGFADGTGQLFNDLDLRRRAFSGDVVSLSMSPLTSYGVTSAERDRGFYEWGYIRRKSVEEVKQRGDYFVDETQNQAFIKLLPGYHPHTVVGQNSQGQLVAVAVIGETNKAGATLQGLAEDLKRQGIVNAVVVGNGKDAQIYSGGQSAAVAGAYPTASALLSIFPSSKAAGRATAVRWLTEFEKIGALLSGEAGQTQWGKAYKDFAATIELSSAFAVMLAGLGGTLVLAGSPLGWAVAPSLGAVFGWRFYKGHFLNPGESGPVTPVKVSVPKAFTMAVIYGILISVTPFFLAFGPDSLAFFSPVLAEMLWGSAAALHLFFDRKTSAAREGTIVARHFIAQLSTVPGAFNFLNPITADRTNQLLNSGPFSPDLADQTLRRLQTEPEFRASFLTQIRSALQDNQLSPLQLNLLSALLVSTSEPFGIVHFLGTDPEKELDRVESLVSPSARVTVVAPIEQSPGVWQRTESLKTLGVNVVRKNIGDQGWTERQLTELEREISSWLQSVPSSLLVTVGPGVQIDPAEIEFLAPDSRLKRALSSAVGLLGKTLELYFRILQAVHSSA